MIKEDIFQKMRDCRRIADEVCCALWKMEISNERTELLIQVDKVLDEIDSFLAYRSEFDEEDDASNAD